MFERLLSSIAALGVVIAPALLKIGGNSTTASDVVIEQDAEELCARESAAPIHEKYRGISDIKDHLAKGSVVQVVGKRKNWKRVAYTSQGIVDTGWMTSANLEECAQRVAEPTPAAEVPARAPAAPTHNAAACGGPPLTVTFFDVGQALSALIDLPNRRRILIDTGEQAARAGCGAPCKQWSDRLFGKLNRAVPDRKLEFLWITHQHSDHAGNAPRILREFEVGSLIDNGTNLENGIIRKTRQAARDRGVRLRVVDPDHSAAPEGTFGEVRLTPVVSREWVADCEDEPNDCSIALRIDYCGSSLLFTGDAEQGEEDSLDPGPVTLLQVGHHGSATSSSEPFIRRTMPQYAVVSSGKPSEGTNRTYCHPRKSTVDELNRIIGGPATKTISAFDGASCRRDVSAWREVAASDHVWFTARDGDVTLVTSGDGRFERRPD